MLESDKLSCEVQIMESMINLQTTKPLLKVRFFKWENATNQSTTQALGSAELREKMAGVQNLTEEEIDLLAKKFLEDAKAGRIQSEGWFGDSKILMSLATYRVSKLLLNAYTRMLARDFHSQIQSATMQQRLVVFVNAATPGLTLTDLARPFIDARGIDLAAVNTPEQGADTIMWLALLPREGHPMGRLFCNRVDVAF